MDEMPSKALNGLTPNEAKQVRVENELIKHKKHEKYIPQQNACLPRSDAKLFYKIYFALLDFTNKKYQISPELKINSKKGVNPNELTDILDKLWDNKDAIVLEFCLANPNKFTKEELKLTKDFKKGIRDIFIIANYEKEYTALLNQNKLYMIKGLNDNIDNIIPYNQLPHVAITTIIPFKNYIVYDGILMSMPIKMGNNFNKMIEDELENSIKYLSSYNLNLKIRTNKYFFNT